MIFVFFIIHCFISYYLCKLAKESLTQYWADNDVLEECVCSQFISVRSENWQKKTLCGSTCAYKFWLVFPKCVDIESYIVRLSLHSSAFTRAHNSWKKKDFGTLTRGGVECSRAPWHSCNMTAGSCECHVTCRKWISGEVGGGRNGSWRGSAKASAVVSGVTSLLGLSLMSAREIARPEYIVNYYKLVSSKY